MSATLTCPGCQTTYTAERMNVAVVPDRAVSFVCAVCGQENLALFAHTRTWYGKKVFQASVTPTETPRG